MPYTSIENKQRQCIYMLGSYENDYLNVDAEQYYYYTSSMHKVLGVADPKAINGYAIRIKL